MGQRGQVYCVVDADPVAERAPDLGKNGCLRVGSLASHLIKTKKHLLFDKQVLPAQQKISIMSVIVRHYVGLELAVHSNFFAIPNKTAAHMDAFWGARCEGLKGAAQGADDVRKVAPIVALGGVGHARQKLLLQESRGQPLPVPLRRLDSRVIISISICSHLGGRHLVGNLLHLSVLGLLGQPFRHRDLRDVRRLTWRQPHPFHPAPGIKGSEQ